MKKNELNKLRKIMGTNPDANPKLKTSFYKGCTGMTIELIDYPQNPYKSIYVLATSCWGKRINKWQRTSVQGRIAVVNAVLKKMALPLAYEAPKFTFAVENIPRWSFDQIARARLGIVFSSRGTRDNNHLDAGFFIHDEIWNDKELRKEFMNATLKCKEVYKKILEKNKGNWQAARSILPISNTHAFSFSANYAALQSMCMKRMKFCEADATTGFGWLLKEVINKKFPLLAKYLVPGCDIRGICQYNKAYYLSNAFGCLFKPCGRNQCEGDSTYTEVNRSCSDRKLIMKQLKIYIPTAEEIRKQLRDDKISKKDLKLFKEN